MPFRITCSRGDQRPCQTPRHSPRLRQISKAAVPTRGSLSTNASPGLPTNQARGLAPSFMSTSRPRSKPPKPWTGSARSEPHRRPLPEFRSRSRICSTSRARSRGPAPGRSTIPLRRRRTRLVHPRASVTARSKSAQIAQPLNLVPKLQFGNRLRETLFRRGKYQVETEFPGGRSQTGVWERGGHGCATSAGISRRV